MEDLPEKYLTGGGGGGGGGDVYLNNAQNNIRANILRTENMCFNL